MNGSDWRREILPSTSILKKLLCYLHEREAEMSKWGKKDKSEEEKCKGWLTVLFPLKLLIYMTSFHLLKTMLFCSIN